MKVSYEGGDDDCQWERSTEQQMQGGGTEIRKGRRESQRLKQEKALCRGSQEKEDAGSKCRFD